VHLVPSYLIFQRHINHVSGHLIDQLKLFGFSSILRLGSYSLSFRISHS
jgi:hypothetical protein